MPRLNQLAKCCCSLESFKLSQSFDGESVWRYLLVLAVKFLIRSSEVLFVRNSEALAIGEVEETKWTSITAAFVAKNFALNKRGASTLTYLEGIGHQTLNAADKHSVLNFYEDCFVRGITAENFPESASRIQCLTYRALKAIVQEAEDVKKRAFPRTIGSDNDKK